jgi:uncharacterized protein
MSQITRGPSRATATLGRYTALAALTLAATAGCRSARAPIPSVTPQPTGEYRDGKFVWLDLVTTDLPGVKRFYGELFGWTFEDVAGTDYTVISHQGRPMAGIVNRPTEAGSLWIASMSVRNVDTAAAYVSAHGGKVLRSPRDVPDRGRLGVVADPDGAIFAIMRSGTGDPADREAQPGDWLWMELWTNDLDSAASFYTGLVGYKDTTVVMPGAGGYHVFAKDRQPRAGVVKIPLQGVRPHWLPYIAVTTPDPIVSRVESLGGKVYLAPSRVADGQAAIIADPSGAVITIQEWPVRRGNP